MKYHVLPGDAYVETFRETNLKGEIIVCREALIEGPVEVENLEEFWLEREKYFAVADTEYNFGEKVKAEFEKLRSLPENSEVNLWFEYELFCQANYWFCIHLLRETKTRVYRIAPVVRTENEVWKGFGKMGAQEMKTCFESRVELKSADVEIGNDLWQAYRERNHARLLELSTLVSEAFPFLREVCKAEVEKGFRPLNTIRDIKEHGFQDFKDVFRKFAEREPVYGYGDVQVKRLIAKAT
ncbi:MAG: DUF1835 domain-containing protein [Acidobacteria bacterium]|nr:DUF1835 domain-containing protein [Acidobacteriota bacterium]